MKIFTPVKLNRIEDSESVSLRHFATREEALTALREAAEDDIEDLKRNDLIGIDENGDEDGTWFPDDKMAYSIIAPLLMYLSLRIVMLSRNDNLTIFAKKPVLLNQFHSRFPSEECTS